MSLKKDIVALYVVLKRNFRRDKKELEKEAEKAAEYVDKVRNITYKEKSEGVIKALELDKELTVFLDKYSSGKEADYHEYRLNIEWIRKGDYFVDKADKIISEMSIFEMLQVIQLTENLYKIIKFPKHLVPLEPECVIKYANPSNWLQYYLNAASLDDKIYYESINDEYYYLFNDCLKLENLQYFILKHMDEKERELLYMNVSERQLEKIKMYEGGYGVIQ